MQMENFAPIMFGGLVLVMLVGFPVAFSLAALGLASGLFAIEMGWFPAAFMSNLPISIFSILSNDLLLAIPFFTFMGTILEKCGLAACGVAVEEGLARAMHKRKVYLKWLRLFASSQAAFGDEVAAALQQGDIARVQLLAHTLKGAASNVSAETVRQQAEQLESLARQGETVVAMAAALAATVEALQPVRDAIAALPDGA